MISEEKFKEDLINDLADVLQKYHIQEVMFVPAKVIAEEFVLKLTNAHTYQTLYAEREKIKYRFQEVLNVINKGQR